MIRLPAAVTVTALVITALVVTLLVIIAFALFAPAATPPAFAKAPGPPLPPCEAKAPAAVLDCLYAALNAGDMNALDNVLARDFVSDNESHEGVPTPDPADREMFLKLMRFLFNNDRVETYTFSFSFEGDAREVEPGTWRLEGVKSALEVSGTDTVWKDGVKSEVPNQRRRVETTDTFVIREVRDPVAPAGKGRHFEIVRWTEGS